MTGNPYRKAVYRNNRAAVIAAAGGVCEWPGCSNPATQVDHVIPLARGGPNTVENLRASCPTCNSRGGAAIATENKRAKRIGRRSRPW